jgi:hypothetical protein
VDLNELQYLTDLEKSRYMMMERLFAQPGWTEVIKQAEQGVQETVMRGANAATWEENRIALGGRVVYAWLVNLQQSTDLEFEQLAAEAKAAKQEKDEQDFE